MRQEHHQSLINYRLEQAEEALQDGELLLNSCRYRATANRLYYACFYAAVAALLTRRLEQLPKEYSKTLHRAFNERQQDDYMPFVELDAGEISVLFEHVRSMVQGVRKYVTDHR